MIPLSQDWVNRTMKIFLTGSIPTYLHGEERDLSSQEVPFTTACMDIGYELSSRGHTIVLCDDHAATVDHLVMQGMLKYAVENPDTKVQLQLHRTEGSKIPYTDLPKNVVIVRRFHEGTEDKGGSLIPNLAALEASDVLIIIGGKLTAKLMGNISADREKGVLAIPAFGGSATELYERLKYLYKSALKGHFDDLSILQSAWTDASAKKIIDIAELLARKSTAAEPNSYFISYTWGESETADHIEVLLRRQERIVNRDENIFRAGTDLSDVVKSLINESDTFIGIWSAKYKQSTWCPSELEYAINRQSRGEKPTRVVMIMTDETEPPIRCVGKLRLPGEDRSKRELSIRKLIEEEG
jgi:hypothetical protein